MNCAKVTEQQHELQQRNNTELSPRTRTINEAIWSNGRSSDAEELYWLVKEIAEFTIQTNAFSPYIASLTGILALKRIGGDMTKRFNWYGDYFPQWCSDAQKQIAHIKTLYPDTIFDETPIFIPIRVFKKK